MYTLFAASRSPRSLPHLPEGQRLVGDELPDLPGLLPDLPGEVVDLSAAKMHPFEILPNLTKIEKLWQTFGQHFYAEPALAEPRKSRSGFAKVRGTRLVASPTAASTCAARPSTAGDVENGSIARQHDGSTDNDDEDDDKRYL